MNDEFDPDDKNSFSYYHIYIENGKIFTNGETLFGTAICDFDNEKSCDRECKKKLIRSSSL